MNKQITQDGFKRLTDSIIEKIVEYKRAESEAMISGNSLREQYSRERASAFELALFSINLHSSIVDDKE